jgi:hypothetical protein
VNQVTDFGTLKNNKSTIGFTGFTDDWQCEAIYFGDAEFGETDHPLSINLCRPVDSCHDNGNSLKKRPQMSTAAERD